MKSNDELQFVKPLTWDEVFDIWRGNEENEEHWKIYYKAKNFNSWGEWRKKYIEPIRAMNKEWGLYRILDPMKTVPAFHSGRYKGWLPFYGGQKFPTFYEIMRHPDIDKHKGIPEFMNNFAKKTTIIAWLAKQGVVIIEGMHRCAAIALAAKQGKKIETEMHVALAECMEKDIPDFTTDNEKK